MRKTALPAGAVTVMMLFAAVGSPVYAVTRRVSESGSSCRRAEYTSIQSAVYASEDGDKIVVCPGVYDEQVVFNKRLRVRGKTGAVVRPSSMSANTTSQRTGESIASVLTIARDTTVKGLVVDASNNGLECAQTGPLLVGVFFRGASGSFSSGEVTGAKFGTSDLDCESGAAILIQGNGLARHGGIGRE